MRNDNRRDDVAFQARGRLTKLFNLRSAADPTLNKLSEYVEAQAAKLCNAGIPVYIQPTDIRTHGPAPSRDWHDSFSRDLDLSDSEGGKPRFVMNLHLDLQRRTKWELNVTVTLRRADTNSQLDTAAKGEVLAKEYFEPENTRGIERFITRKMAEVAAHMTHTAHPDEIPGRPSRQVQDVTAGQTQTRASSRKKKQRNATPAS